MRRIYITVDCREYKTGEKRPLRIHWSDGRHWDVSRLIQLEYPQKDEFKGVRYTVLINNVEKQLYRYNEQWYVMSDE